MKKNIVDGVMKVAVFILAVIVQIAITCGWIYIITLCFDTVFNIRVAIGIWLIIEFIRYNVRLDVS